MSMRHYDGHGSAHLGSSAATSCRRQPTAIGWKGARPVIPGVMLLSG